MHIDVRAAPVLVPELLLNAGGTVVRLAQGHVPVHADMQIDGITVSHTPRAQVMRLLTVSHTPRAQVMRLRHPVYREHQVGDALLHIVGERTL